VNSSNGLFRDFGGEGITEFPSQRGGRRGTISCDVSAVWHAGRARPSSGPSLITTSVT
jgi:hypothetical protein